MGRTKKGRKLSGWLIVDKPAGIGSTDVVNKVKWLLKAQKAGHAGTLDPAATGVLALAFGEATKTVAILTDPMMPRAQFWPPAICGQTQPQSLRLWRGFAVRSCKCRHKSQP